MKKGFFHSFAVNNIRKNKKLYYPYLLSSVLMIAIFYIICYLGFCDEVINKPGGGIIAATMFLGMIVMAVFSIAFLQYTNSFLMKRREKEYGLYLVLGMNKRNISRIIFNEMIVISILALIIGLFSGISLSKLFELAFMKIINRQSNYSFEIPLATVVITMILYAFIFALISILSVIRINRKNAVDIIKADSYGEKVPKANSLLGIGSIILLISAYIIALKCTSPLAALKMFFIAVLMVIVATFMLFISGSVLLVSVLQKKKKLYYITKNFISISSLRFRMKRNGSGLASICILSTMLLVTMTTTGCMYFGQKDTLNRMYPRDIVIQYICSDYDCFKDKNMLSECDEKILQGLDYRDVISSEYIHTMGTVKNGVFELEKEEINIVHLDDFDGIRNVIFYSTKQYFSIYGEKTALADDEALIYSNVGKYNYSTFQMADSDNVYRIVGEANDVDIYDNDIIGTIVVIVNNPQQLLGDYLKDERNVNFTFYHNLLFNIEAEDNLMEDIYDLRSDIVSIGMDYGFDETFYYGCRQNDSKDFYETYGSLFFVGTLLSSAFLIITVMIIYYKQISEGYEDVARFDIMRKVGINSADVKSSINTQMKMIFFLPVIMAVMHLLFAFSMIRGILLLFNINNIILLIHITSVITLLFVIFYILVYRFTARTYYDIVSAKSPI